MRYSFASLWHASSQSTLHVQTCAGLPDSDSAYQGQQPVRQPLKDLIPNVQRSEQGSHPFAKTKQAPMLKFPAPANRWDPDAENGVENGDGGEGGKITARIRPPPSRTKRNGTASIFEEVTSTHGFVPSKSAFRKLLQSPPKKARSAARIVPQQTSEPEADTPDSPSSSAAGDTPSKSSALVDELKAKLRERKSRSHITTKDKPSP
eukprot:3209522-Rhodomonas_salina.1